MCQVWGLFPIIIIHRTDVGRMSVAQASAGSLLLKLNHRQLPTYAAPLLPNHILISIAVKRL